MDVRVVLWRRLNTEELMLLNCGVGEDSWESFGLQEDPTSPFWRRSTLGFLWKDWCWSWNSSTLATSWEELTHWKRLWCWERVGAGGERGEPGWDGWMASLTRWTCVWVRSGRWWWTGRLGVLRFMGSQRFGHDWGTELNWTELKRGLETGLKKEDALKAFQQQRIAGLKVKQWESVRHILGGRVNGSFWLSLWVRIGKSSSGGPILRNWMSGFYWLEMLSCCQRLFEQNNKEM